MTVDRSSSTVTVQWEREDCIERNGYISHYVLAIGSSCDNLKLMNVTPQLIPSNTVAYTLSSQFPSELKDYVFQVASANDKGRGPFSQAVRVSDIHEG